MIGAYILVVTKMGRLNTVTPKIESMDNVETVSFVSGTYDIIVRANVPCMSGLMHLKDQMYKTGDIEKTVTHVISREEKKSIQQVK